MKQIIVLLNEGFTARPDVVRPLREVEEERYQHTGGGSSFRPLWIFFPPITLKPLSKLSGVLLILIAALRKESA